MDLILWRHAEAEDGWDDLRRKLTPKGQRQAEKMSKWLTKQLHGKSICLITSGAKRSQQTMARLSQDFSIEPRLNPGADPVDYLEVFNQGGMRLDAVVMVGHQPEIGRVASLLLTGIEADWAVKKGAVWWLRQRSCLEAGSAYELRAMMLPQML